MIVSLSLIRLDTVLRLERQQMATHESSRKMRPSCDDCEPVART